MENVNQNIRQEVIKAVSFSIFFLLLVALNYLWQISSIDLAWKVAASVALALLILFFIGKTQIIVFGGFCMLLVGLNLLWQSPTVPDLLKVLGSLVVLLQFGNLGNVKNDLTGKPSED